MNLEFKVVDSLEKVFWNTGMSALEELPSTVEMLCNDRFTFQLAWSFHGPTAESALCALEVDCPLEVRTETVLPVAAMLPCRGEVDDGYISRTPFLAPDLMQPLDDGLFKAAPDTSGSIFLTVSSHDSCCGAYDLDLTVRSLDGEILFSSCLKIHVAEYRLGELGLYHTQWFHQDSLISYYGFDCWSETHWQTVARWLAYAHDRCAVNTVLTPVFTPPLDTAVGGERMTVQLADIYLFERRYTFNFSRLERWCALCHKAGIENIEVPHLFTQWGARCCPKIMVNENGHVHNRFGWNVEALDEEYIRFLKAFIPALISALDSYGYDESHVFFHVSDEPRGAQIEQYAKCKRIVDSLVGGCRVIDALSSHEFYTRGIVQLPVISDDHVCDFTLEECRGKWVYYCVSQKKLVPNRFMALPSARCRIMGALMYLYGFSGFLHWGFNFYFTQLSTHAVNPYVSTDAGLSFPSGDPFLVYPGPSFSPLSSLRNEVQMDGLCDYRLLVSYEERHGRQAAVDLLDRLAGYRMTFEHYPTCNSFFRQLRCAVAGCLEEET